MLSLSCASCAASSQEILLMQPGVLSASVNYANATGTIEFDTSVTSARKLKDVLVSAGYDLFIEEGDEAEAALEKKRASEYSSLRKRTYGAIALSIPLVIIGMVPAFMSMPYANYIMWALATPVVFLSGNSFFMRAVRQLRHRKFSMDTLVALSTGTAYIFSVFNTLFPHYWHSRGLHAHVYFEASAVVIAFLLLGKLLEERAKGNTSAALRKLIGLQPKTVIVTDALGQHREIPLAAVAVGDTILARAGEKIAVDGRVVEGSSFIDESTITGEPIPVSKSPGSQVFAGTINGEGSFTYAAQSVGRETLLGQIITMVQGAQASKAPVQQLADKVAGIFVPVVMVLALVAFAAWNIFGGTNGFSYGLLAMITVLVIACPCALGLATPTAIMVGVGRGAENGILIKDAESLEKARKIDTVVLDKTGTLSEGRPTVVSAEWFGNESMELRSVLYTIEKNSSHPLAGAVCDFLGTTATLSGYTITNIAGKGIIAEGAAGNFYVGSRAMLADNHISLSAVQLAWIEGSEQRGETLVLFANKSGLLAAFSVSDALKPTSAAAVHQLKQMGIEVHMLTGDNEFAAKNIASLSGVSVYRAGVSPQDKGSYIANLQGQGKVVAMVGDGINDSAALALADVGIAMGRGSDIAIESADIALITGDLMKLPQGIRLSKQTVATIRQNLFWAFIYNVIGIPVAAGALYPFNGFLLNPMLAGAAMALSSLSVVGNSLLLNTKKI